MENWVKNTLHRKEELQFSKKHGNFINMEIDIEEIAGEYE